MRNKIERSIYVEEYVRINGIEQYLFHSGTNYDNPVLLYLHGGPGSVESLFTHLFQEKLEDIYTIVHWDQRGAGKTFTKNKDKYPTIELLIKDLFEVIQYLKKKYNKQKIVLLGRSWGSVLGSYFIKRYPEEVEYYIGVAQVITLHENERVGYEKLKEMLTEANDQKSLKKLQAIGDYPGDKLVLDDIFMKKCSEVRKLQGKYGLAGKNDFSIIMKIFRSPVFRLPDISAFMNIFKVNRKVLEEFFADTYLKEEPAVYQVPVYYILGEDDWQAPYVIAQEYFTKIEAPNKKLFMIPNAGHRIMIDQPESFYEALLEIKNNNKNKEISVV